MGVNGIYGLSGSGIDVESMVKVGMLSRQSTYDKMYQKEIKNEWLKEGFNSIYNDLNTFKYSSLSDYKMQSNMSAMKASSSNSSVLSASANGAAVAMTHTVKVESTSSNAYLITGNEGMSRASGKDSTSMYLSDVLFKSMNVVNAYEKDGVTYSLMKNDEGGYDLVGENGESEGRHYETITDFEKEYETQGYTLKTGLMRLESAVKATKLEGVEIDTDPDTDSPRYIDANGKEITSFMIRETNDDGETTERVIDADELFDDDGYLKSDYANKEILIGTESTVTTRVQATDENGNLLFESDGTTPVMTEETEDVVTYVAAKKKEVDVEGKSTYKYVDPDATAVSFTLRDTDDALTSAEKKKQTVSYTYQQLMDGKTLYDFAADIKAKGTNIQASYDATNDAFSLYNSMGGSKNTISFDIAADSEDGKDLGGQYAAELLNRLGLQQSLNGALSAIGEFKSGETGSVVGENGKIIIDGRTYTDIEDNHITVAGVTYSLLDKTPPDTTVKVTVTQDTDKIVDYVKKFVEDYNKILDDLQEKYSERPESDYKPLSKTQEAQMTEDQIEKWTKKAKTGLFYHNEILGKIIDAMQNAIATPVESVNSRYNSAYAIGIDTTGNKGHLTLDEDKLREALAADPDCVYQIFANDQDTYSDVDANKRQAYMKADDYNNTGIANRLYFGGITDGINEIQAYAGYSADGDDQSSLGLIITDLKNRMENFKLQMDDYQTLLYKKYDAMETLISRLSMQYNTIFGANS